MSDGEVTVGMQDGETEDVVMSLAEGLEAGLLVAGEDDGETEGEVAGGMA